MTTAPDSSPTDPASVLLIRLWRAGEMESVHRGRYLITEGDAVIASGGDINEPIFVRSSAKPMQALSGITSGAARSFDLPPESLAIAAGSHSATPEHIAAVEHTLRQAGIDEDQLQCGGHWSIDPEAARQQCLPDGVKTPPKTWNNCSGKHAMMLATSKALGAPLKGYLDPAHPTQQLILEHVAAVCGVDASDVPVAIDGCGAPAPRLSFPVLARGLRHFATPRALPSALDDAVSQISHAMRTHPNLVGGPQRFDTDLMESANGEILSKCGAEGVIAVVVPKRDLVLVAKVDDGNDRGYRMFVLRVLEQLGVLSAAQTELLSARHAPVLMTNHAGTEVGHAEVLLPAI